MLVEKGDDTGAVDAVVRPAIVATAVLEPDLLEALGDLVDRFGHETGQGEKAEGFKEIELGLGEAELGHGSLS